MCRARLEIAQLRRVRRMWMTLQRRIRHLIRGRIFNEDANSANATTSNSNNNNLNNNSNSNNTNNSSNNNSNANQGQSSTSNAESQTEPARNYKKLLLENYKRQSGGSNGEESTPGSSQNPDIVESPNPAPSTSATASLSPSNESELQRMRNLCELLNNWFSAYSNKVSTNSHDHTYSNLFVDPVPGTSAASTSNTNANNDANNPESGAENSENLDDVAQAESEEASTSGSVSESTTSHSHAALERHSRYQRVWRYGRRMYLRRPRLLSVGPRSIKRAARLQSLQGPLRRCPRNRSSSITAAGTSTSGADPAARGAAPTTSSSESLQSMIVTLQSLIAEQRDLTNRETNSASGSASSQAESIERSREQARQQARQVLTLMVENLSQLLEENRGGGDSSTGGGAHSSLLQEEVFRMFILPCLGLRLTDLLLEQLAVTRREIRNNQFSFEPSTLRAARQSRENTANANHNRVFTPIGNSNSGPNSLVGLTLPRTQVSVRVGHSTADASTTTNNSGTETVYDRFRRVYRNALTRWVDSKVIF